MRYGVRLDASKYGDSWEVVQTKSPSWWPFCNWLYVHQFDKEEEAEAFIRRATAHNGVRKVPPFKFPEPPQEQADDPK